MSNVLAVLALIAQTSPGLQVQKALALAEQINALYPEPNLPFDWHRATFDQRVAYTRTLPTVMSNLPDRKIGAIKELRMISNLGLREAKDVIDAIQPPPYY